MVPGWWDRAPLWNRTAQWTCTCLACNPHPACVWAGVIGTIDQVSLDSLSLESKLSGKEGIACSWMLVDPSRSYSLSAGHDEWVGSSSSSLLVPAARIADVTLSLSR